MAHFLRRISPFGALLCAFFVFNYLTNQALKRFHRTVLPDEVHTVIFGDSHSQLAIDPGQLPGSVNMAGSAEPPMITYFKAMRVLDWNPQITTVVLGVGPHNIAPFNDRKLVEEWSSRELLERYHGIVPWDSMADVPMDRSARFMVWVQQEILPNFHLLDDARLSLLGSRTSHPFEGGYGGQPAAPLSDEGLAATLNRHFPGGGAEAPSEIQLRYIRMLQEECVRRGLRTVLVSTPLRVEYRNAIPRGLTAGFDQLFNDLRGKDGVAVLDLSSLPLDSAMFRDFDHVSEAGAAIVSETLEEFLETVGNPQNRF